MREIIYSVTKAYAAEIQEDSSQGLQVILAKLFTALEAEHTVSISAKEKTFIGLQLNEIIKVIAEIESNSTIEIAQIPKLQNGLELLLHGAYYAIEKGEIPTKGIALNITTMLNASVSDDRKIVEDIAAHIYDRSEVKETHGAKITYAPAEKKAATSLEQEYFVSVRVEKRDQNATTQFVEIVPFNQSLRDSDDSNIVISLLNGITSRDISELDLAGATVEFSRKRLPSSSDQEYSVTVTVSKGSQSGSISFNETIPASIKSLEANEIEILTLANQINDRTLPSDLNGISVTFSPAEKQAATSVNQEYPVLVTLQKDDLNLTISFLEKVAYDEAMHNAAIIADDSKDVEEVLSKISDREVPTVTSSTIVTFDPSHPKLATRKEQTYDVTVTVLKGAQTKSKSFSETVLALTTHEENLALIESLIVNISSRDINITAFNKQGINVTFDPPYATSKEGTDLGGVYVTLTKGAVTKVNSFAELVYGSDVYVSFSGGGWHSHTTLAAWLMGAMDAMDKDEAGTGTLVNLAKNIDGLSCNSGGCWFATQLVFSQEFASKLETQTNEEYLGADGYLGQTKKIFKEDLEHLTVSDEYIKLLKYTTNWLDFMQKSSFKPFGMTEGLANTTLDSSHLAWADAIPLVYAASLNTNTFVSSDDGILGDYKTYYQAGKASSEDWFNGEVNPFDALSRTQTYTAASFTSLGSYIDNKSPVFLEGDIKLRYAYYHSTYPWIEATTIPANHPSGGVNVINAASSSSAAPGIGANISYASSESAIGFEVTVSGFEQYTDDGQMDEAYATTAEKRRVRFSDGGYVDNSSVAHMLKHIQANNPKKPFKIVLFMNSSANDVSAQNINKVSIPTSAAILFGKAKDNPVKEKGTINFSGIIDVPSADVFTEASWDTGKSYWKRENNDTYLEYVRFDVTTKENPRFGISAGTTGELHIFVGTMADSNAMPDQGAAATGIFNVRSKTIDHVLGTYETMLKDTRGAVTEEGGAWVHLKRALNL